MEHRLGGGEWRSRSSLSLSLPLTRMGTTSPSRVRPGCASAVLDGDVGDAVGGAFEGVLAFGVVEGGGDLRAGVGAALNGEGDALGALGCGALRVRQGSAACAVGCGGCILLRGAIGGGQGDLDSSVGGVGLVGGVPDVASLTLGSLSPLPETDVFHLSRLVSCWRRVLTALVRFSDRFWL